MTPELAQIHRERIEHARKKLEEEEWILRWLLEAQGPEITKSRESTCEGDLELRNYGELEAIFVFRYGRWALYSYMFK